LNKDDEIKKAILLAAKHVFQKWGLNKTTMEDIAHEAGKGKSTLYYYYKSKEEIFEAATNEELNNIAIRVRAIIEQIKSPKEKLKRYIAITLTEIKKTTSIYPLVKGEIKGNTKFIDKIRKQLDNREEAIVKEILKQGINSDEFNFLKEEQLDKAANVIVGIIRGLELYLFLEMDDEEKIDIVTSLITEGL
jgi:AcrR family transcriptional regulator